MDWKPITEEEAKGLNFASRTGKENPYKALFEAVAKGPVRVNVTPDKLQSLKWSLSRAIKKAGLKIVVSTLAEKNGVVLTMEGDETTKKK